MTRGHEVFERIVCGVDGSPAGDEGLRQAIALRPPEGELAVVVVVDLAVAVQSGFQAARTAQRLEQEAEVARAAVAERIAGVPFTSVGVVHGRPVAALLAAAERRNAGLVVVGSHGQSRAVGILVGSVASEMLHRASCSVLVARRPADGTLWAPRTIVVGIDGSACAYQALSTARELSERFEAHVRVLACGDGLPQDELERVGERVELDDRNPVDALVAAAATADLVVIGSRGLSGLRALGSVSERVAHRASSSVLVVRS